MKLANPFPLEVRLLYLYCHFCFNCGSNGWKRGGLELHHITGRDSDSAFNASPLCGQCHSHMVHTQDEERELFKHNLQWLEDQSYTPIEKDWEHIRNHPHLVIHNEPL